MSDVTSDPATAQGSRGHTVRYLGIGVLLLAVLGVGVGVWWWSRPKGPTKTETPTPQEAKQREVAAIPHVAFRDITESSGIRFHHTSGAFGKKLLPETMGSGVAFLDFDGDGKQDVLFINSCYWPGHEDKTQPAPTLALYRNLGHGKFEDATEAAGLKLTLYGMGVTVGDYDNDGWPDVFITAVGGNRLFHNEPDGKGGRHFVEVTGHAGVGGPGGWPTAGGDFMALGELINYSSSATFLDYDGDGKLDLFVCNYVTWSPALDLGQDFRLVGVGRAYGPPTNFPGTQCFLYRNLGDGKFADVSAEAGIQVKDQLGRLVGKSLGVIACDVDGDGWPDIFVANDTARNFFFHNEPDGKGGRKFVEAGIKSGVAYAEGQTRGAMGIDFGEYRPGQLALLITNFQNEPDTLLRLDRPRHPTASLLFSDVAVVEGVYGPSRSLLKFGAFYFDYDLDGRLDLLTCNGHLEPDISKVQGDVSYPQPVQLFWNNGADRRRYDPVTAKEAGDDLFHPLVGRGAAFADLDGDGHLTVALTSNGGPARLLRCEGGTGNHWVRLVLKGDGVHSNRSAIGAVVTVKAGDQVLRREVLAGRGYLSQSELPLTIGIGKATKVDSVTIRWPGRDVGEPQVVTEVKVDQENVIEQAAKK